MKKVLITLSLTAFAVSVFAQGTVNYVNSGSGFRAPIYGPQAGDPTASVIGNPASTVGNPGGTAVYTGALLSGPGFMGQYFAASGADQPEASLVGATTVNVFRTGNVAGLMAVTIATFSNIPSASASPGTVQLRAWDNSSGLYPTWADADVAWRAGLIAAGKGTPFNVASFGGGTVTPTAPAGVRSFNIYMIPEPSTFALAGLGAAALLIFRRRD